MNTGLFDSAEKDVKMARRTNKQLVSREREYKICEKAHDIRKLQSEEGSVCPLRGLEIDVVSEVKEFDFFVGDQFFEGMPSVEAYVNMKTRKQGFMREQLASIAFDGGRSERFTAAHELGHAVLHHKTKMAFARNFLDSNEYYLEQFVRKPVFEAEANIFAGAYLAPAFILQPNWSASEIAMAFRISSSAASKVRQTANRCREWREFIAKRNSLS